MGMDISGRLIRNKYRILSLSWVLLIYGTLYIVRPVCDFLKEHIRFGLVLNVAMVIALLLVVTLCALKIRGYLSRAILVLVMTAYSAALCIIKFPEEKLHLVEYGILAYLLFMAVKDRVTPARAYAAALMLASFFGWLDEAIQYFLPNRYYQNSDVILNAFSAAMALTIIYIFRRSRA